MTQQMIGIVYQNFTPTEKHLFKLPSYGEPNYQPALTSFNAFNRRRAKSTDGKHATLFSLDRFEKFELIYFRALNIDEAKLKTFEHETLWDTYLAIGYDFKKKRYVK